MDIEGFVIVGSTYTGSAQNSFFGNGTIKGGVISTCKLPTLLPGNVKGPGVGPIDWRTILHQIEIGNGIHISYKKPVKLPPGFRSIGQKTKILTWQSD